MWRWEDVKMWRCEDEKMWRWEDVKMRRCEDVRMWRCEDVKMWGCEYVKMWRWEDVRMRRCEDEKIRRWDTDPRYRKNPALRRSREQKPNMQKIGTLRKDEATCRPTSPASGWKNFSDLSAMVPSGTADRRQAQANVTWLLTCDPAISCGATSHKHSSSMLQHPTSLSGLIVGLLRLFLAWLPRANWVQDASVNMSFKDPGHNT